MAHFKIGSVLSGGPVLTGILKETAAANRLGMKSAPLICTNGQPSTAVNVLLGQLNRAGIRVHYHGDFDWPGIQIANAIMAQHAAESWRLSADDYRRAATGALQLSGTAIAASWDADLAPTMTDIGRAVHEEQVLEELLADLSTTRDVYSSIRGP